MGFFNFLYQVRPVNLIKCDADSDLTTTYPPLNLNMLSHTKPRMPVELVMNILETAYDDDTPEDNVELYTKCALVCRDWSVIAQKLLFRHVSLQSQTAYIAFQHAVDRSTPRGRMLGNAVTSMQITLDHNQPYFLSQRSFARAVTFCPNLHELNVALYGRGGPGHDVVGVPDEDRMKRIAPSFDASTLALLRTGPRITSLNFSNWSDNNTSLLQLLDVWPSLKTLAISGTPPQLDNDSPQPSPCALEGLRMNFQTMPSADFLKWLLHNSTGSLRSLELEREPASDVLEQLMADHGSTLWSLSLPTCGGHDGIAAIRGFESLRDFRMESAWAPPTALKALPETVEHLAFGLDMDTSLPPVLHAIKTSETLKAVTVQMWHGGEGHPRLNALKIACARQGIELRMTTDVRVFRTVSRNVLKSLPLILESAC